MRIFHDKTDAEVVTNIISKNKDPWIDIMMVEELGIIRENESPVKNAIVTFISFMVFGFIPVLTYVLSKIVPILHVNTFVLSAILTSLTLFTIGALKLRLQAKTGFCRGWKCFWLVALQQAQHIL